MIAIAGSSVIGVVLGAARAHRLPVVSQLAAVYVEVIRNTPILVQIFFLFYGLPQLARILRFTPFTDGVARRAGLGRGVQHRELPRRLRGGAEALPRGGLALGFGRFATFFSVTLPIGGRIALPSSINTYVSVLKNTSLMTAIGFAELTNVSRSIAALDLQRHRDAAIVAVDLPRCSSGRSPLSSGSSSGGSPSRRRAMPARLDRGITS